MAEPEKISIAKEIKAVSFIGSDEPAIRISGPGPLKTIKTGPDYALDIASRMEGRRELTHLMINMAGLSTKPSRLALDISEGATVKLEHQKYGLAEVSVSGKGKVQTLVDPKFISDVRLVEGKEAGSLVMEGKTGDGMYKPVLNVAKGAKIDIVNPHGKILYSLDGNKTLKENQDALEKAQAAIQVGFITPADLKMFVESGTRLTDIAPRGMALASVNEGRQENPGGNNLPSRDPAIKI